jgi:hypothetical protein
MNKTQHDANERKVEQVEVGPVHLVGLQAMSQAELAAIEGGRQADWGYGCTSPYPTLVTFGGSLKP